MEKKRENIYHSQSGEGEFISHSLYSPLTKKVQAGAPGRIWMPRPWRNTTHSLSYHGLLNLLLFTSQDHRHGCATAHCTLDTATPVMNQNSTLQTCPQTHVTVDRDSSSPLYRVSFAEALSIANPVPAYHTNPSPQHFLA